MKRNQRYRNHDILLDAHSDGRIYRIKVTDDEGKAATWEWHAWNYNSNTPCGIDPDLWQDYASDLIRDLQDPDPPT